MGFLDDAKKLADRAEDLAAEHKSEVKSAIDKAEEAAGGLRGGKYKDQIAGVGGKADDFVDGLKSD